MKIEELFEDRENDERSLALLLLNPVVDLSDKQAIINRVLTYSQIYLDDNVLDGIMYLLKKLWPMHYAWFFKQIAPKIEQMRPLSDRMPR